MPWMAVFVAGWVERSDILPSCSPFLRNNIPVQRENPPKKAGHQQNENHQD
jgi:hypothetical protein